MLHKGGDTFWIGSSVNDNYSKKLHVAVTGLVTEAKPTQTCVTCNSSETQYGVQQAPYYSNMISPSVKTESTTTTSDNTRERSPRY